MIATDTKGQSEILSVYPEIGKLIPCNHAIALADAINYLVNNSQNLASTKKAALFVSQEKLKWENQKDTIVSDIDRSLT